LFVLNNSAPTCFVLITGSSSGFTGLVRRLYTRYRLLFGGRDTVLHHRSWGESRISFYLCVCVSVIWDTCIFIV